MELAVLSERLDNLIKIIGDQHNENKTAHNDIMNQVKFTNGKVKSLQLWKASILGAMGVIMFFSAYMINDYIGIKKTLREHEKEDVFFRDKITEIEKQLSNEHIETN